MTTFAICLAYLAVGGFFLLCLWVVIKMLAVWQEGGEDLRKPIMIVTSGLIMSGIVLAAMVEKF